MTLDLGPLSKQIKQMGEEARANAAAEQSHLVQALGALREGAEDVDALRVKIESSQPYFLAARPLERLDARHPAPQSPNDYVVIASDGSQIEPDRHGMALCYLINVGLALLRYGGNAGAMLRSRPFLHFAEDDLYVVSNNRRILIQGHLLAVKRSIAETDALVEMARRMESSLPIVCLQDGTLVLQTLEGWGLEAEVRDEMLQQFLRGIDDLRRIRLPLASYISRPRSAEVAGLLRILVCPHQVADCSRLCREAIPSNAQPCGWLDGTSDRFIFRELPLGEGERSALFLAASGISLQRYLENKVHFFFLNTGREIARVEVPEWVARDAVLLNAVHAVVLDQSRRGGGYPRALSEAHEKAVITAADRETFWKLVESAMLGTGVPVATSEKLKSKRLRGI
ncbi:MAG: DNA double-strand break repair nuclease NurA [Chloroflexi bacterium]|nr:DNA double-strand break repair nuclease NurA [Chloroflexota bacterium]